MGEEPERAEPVVEADPDDARFLDDLGHISLVRAAVDEPSPVDEHIDRQPSVGRDVRRPPHIDEEAIFRFRSRAVRAFRGGTIGAEGFRLPNVVPAFRRLRWAPALVADRGRAIGNSEESIDCAVVHAADRARFCPHHKCVPILRQGGFSSDTDYASRKSQAKCTHNSPPDAASEDGQYGRYWRLSQVAGSIASRRAEWTPVADEQVLLNRDLGDVERHYRNVCSGEAYSAFAMEWQLWRGIRSFPRRSF